MTYEHTAEEMKAKALEYGVPAHCIEGLVAHVMTGREVGGFLTAVLSNDLMGAMDTADITNRQALHAYAVFLYNVAPRGAYGSRENVKDWRLSGGLDGIERDAA